jgi:hypothetical protein
MLQKKDHATSFLICATICMCTMPLALFAAWCAYNVFIPNPCRYHPHPDHIEPSWAIKLFFHPPDNMGHPEPNTLYFATFVLAGILIDLGLVTLVRQSIRLARRRK